MKRTAMVMMLCLCLLFSAIGVAEEKTAVLFTETGENSELRICSFEEAPNVPYMGIMEFMTNIMDSPMTMEKGEDGVVI